MKRKFEDNEADIITELYAKHFKTTKNESSKMSQTHRDNAKVARDGTLIDDSIGAGFNTDIEDEYERHGSKFAIKSNNDQVAALNGAPKVETYSRPLQDKIRYVQYIPKDAKGTIEDAVNSLYQKNHINRKMHQDDDNGEHNPMMSEQRQAFWDNLANRTSTKNCQNTHRHAAQCAKVKETDLCEI